MEIFDFADGQGIQLIEYNYLNPFSVVQTDYPRCPVGIVSLEVVGIIEKHDVSRADPHPRKAI